MNPNQDDFTNYLKWMQNEKSNPFILGANRELAMRDLFEYVDQKNNSESALLLGLYENFQGSHIGNIKLEPIENSEACLGILIGEEEYRGRSFGYESIVRLLDFSRTQLHLNRIYLGVNTKNLKAIELYKRIGFQLFREKTNVLEMEILL